MFSISIKGGSPIYEQLCGRITELISAGALKKDEKLPAIREVAKALGVNPNTVQKAYQLLEKQGLIYSLPAKGCYVSSTDEAVSFIQRNAVVGFKKSARFALDCGVERKTLSAELDDIANTANTERSDEQNDKA